MVHLVPKSLIQPINVAETSASDKYDKYGVSKRHT
jgi:hypothetical protein